MWKTYLFRACVVIAVLCAVKPWAELLLWLEDLTGKTGLVLLAGFIGTIVVGGNLSNPRPRWTANRKSSSEL